MARHLTTVLTDDIDGGRADRTVEFGLDGVTYTIDLSDQNAGRLRTALQPYLSAATRIGRGGKQEAPRGRGGRRDAPRGRGAKQDASQGSARDLHNAIREWASRTGYELTGPGRMPLSVTEVFHHAH
ncbi:Lsr2 family protein [Actinoplanes sp. NPDC049548]|uniref:histone-like nucleoid-structuring protein Lsr2 n=1 Tax=Actinoplanes sp. NPDC049548 TaxID=3155152 RepID=UPI00341C3E67